MYDNRLEVTSPGGLCYGLTLEEALSGRSRQRNRAIAEVFSQMGLIEAWGNGLKSIARRAKEYHLPSPEFIEMPETFRVNMFRSTASVEKLKSGGTASVEKLKSGGTASVEKLKSGGTTSVAKRDFSMGLTRAHTATTRHMLQQKTSTLMKL